MRAAAWLALAYGLVALGLAVWMMASAASGRPITTPAELLDPEAALLVEGRTIPLGPAGPNWVVTRPMIHAVAWAHIMLFAAAAALWLLAAAGLQRRRPAARVVALVMFAVLAMVGLFNLLAVVALLVLAGGVAAVGGWGAAGGTVLGVVVFLLVLPSLGFLALMRAGRVFSRGPAGRPAAWLQASLAVHFGLVALLLLPAVVAPPSLWPSALLAGPWLLTGTAARWLWFTLAVCHGLCAWGWWYRRTWVLPLSAALHGLLAVAASLSVMAAGDEVLMAAAGGLLPASWIRGLTTGTAVALLALVPVFFRAAGGLRRRRG